MSTSFTPSRLAMLGMALMLFAGCAYALVATRACSDPSLDGAPQLPAHEGGDRPGVSADGIRQAMAPKRTQGREPQQSSPRLHESLELAVRGIVVLDGAPLVIPTKVRLLRGGSALAEADTEKGTGRFSFSVSIPGSYSVSLVGEPPVEGVRLPYDTQGMKPYPNYMSGAIPTFQLTAEQPKVNVELHLQRPGGVAGVLVDLQGRPLTGMVTARDARIAFEDHVYYAQLDGKGRFSFPSMLPGEYYLKFPCPPGDGFESGLFLPLLTAVLPGVSNDLGKLRPRIGDCEICAELVDQYGRPFAGIKGIAYATQEVSEGLRSPGWDAIVGRAVSNENGQIRFDHLPPGPIIVNLAFDWGGGAGRYRKNLLAAPPDVMRLTLSRGQSLDLGLMQLMRSDPFRISGNVSCSKGYRYSMAGLRGVGFKGRLGLAECLDLLAKCMRERSLGRVQYGYFSLDALRSEWQWWCDVPMHDATILLYFDDHCAYWQLDRMKTYTGPKPLLLHLAPEAGVDIELK
jgi:hypothetical protein